MSELTECNYCHLRWLRRDAARNGKVVTLVQLDESSSEMRPPGIDILIHDEGETPDNVKHWAGWFGELSETCCC